VDRRQVRSMTDWTLFELSSSSSIVTERLLRRKEPTSCDVELYRWPTGLTLNREADEELVLQCNAERGWCWDRRGLCACGVRDVVTPGVHP